MPYKDPEKERKRQEKRRQTLEYKEYQRNYRKDNLETSRKIVRKWKRMNSEKTKEINRKSYLKCKYGVNVEDVLELCEVCGKNNGNRYLCVDHNHETGKVRGFLCHSCNVILGHAKDNLALLEKLALYLRERC